MRYRRQTVLLQTWIIFTELRGTNSALNGTLNRPVPIGALDDNGTRHIHLHQHFVDFGDGERGEEGVVI